ncbi:hypothetical protein PFICI_00372 [Pestalotiopsis fici W106-1]|uniref:Transcription factor domain-containing protein n=1 Tax=Pestalotiopsis fici (strain W106-1 / CGMCC3.15140) TaxID=1229662 RepID=W3XKK0_PESFW|nr:uncharacterized protein PFICI_00372 [Pestalotiopsis fici W106-1]ETS86544.1 hypothetical protein PFICI_00372 [Pestalotiopsis fici W106-1]
MLLPAKPVSFSLDVMTVTLLHNIGIFSVARKLVINAKPYKHRRALLFVNVNQPGIPGAAPARRAARSHAARSGHARTRRQRMREYQDRTTRTTQGLSELTVHQEAPIVVSQVPLHRLERAGLVGTALPTREDAFDSSCRTLSSFEHRLFDHYIRFAVPFKARHSQQFTTPELFQHSISTLWVPTAIADLGLLSGVLLYACRSLHMLTNDRRYYELALHYKLECLRLLQEGISLATMDDPTMDIIISRALQLASDEVRHDFPHHSVVTRLLTLQT